jgi:hypothetical protein
MIVRHLALLALMSCAGCEEERVPRTVAKIASPDASHLLWIQNESGGLISGVVTIHVTPTDATPNAQNAILRTPECENTIVGWSGKDRVLIGYDKIYASGFHSTFPTLNGASGQVDLRKRRADDQRTGTIGPSALLPCDPL